MHSPQLVFLETDGWIAKQAARTSGREPLARASRAIG